MRTTPSNLDGHPKVTSPKRKEDDLVSIILYWEYSFGASRVTIITCKYKIIMPIFKNTLNRF